MSGEAVVKLKPGTTVRIGGKVFKGSIPEELCPANLKSVSKPAKAKTSGTA